MSREVGRKISQGQSCRLQCLLQVLGPLLHQVVDVGHGLAVVDGGGGLGPVQVTDVPDPLVHGPGVSAPDPLDPPPLAAGAPRLLADHPQVQLQHAGVTLPGTRLVQDLKRTKNFLGSFPNSNTISQSSVMF